ncbi:ammonium transporter family protein [Phenylobacterium sp.]|uniref:ammonium transporter family protein n=1 Tax=Phenylobacterium sp. TaxID=1871053 RepID=UPI002811764D|nr:ammonium transporter family protein [Phenylobacterium sp.]
MMKLLKSAAVGLTLSLMAAGAVAAAEEMACCKDKKPCCDQMKDGKPMPCCDGHKAQPKPDAPKPAPEPQHQH